MVVHLSRGAFWALLAALCFSGKAVLAKLSYAAMPGLSATSLLGLRMLFAAPAYLLLLWWYMSRFKPLVARRDIAKAAGLGLIGFYLSALLDFEGLRLISAGLERVIVFTYPLWVLLISAFLAGMAITRRQWVAQGVAWLGLVVALWSVWRQTDTTNQNLWQGVLWVLLCAISFAIYLTAAAPVMKRLGSVVFISVAQIAAGLAIFIHIILLQPTILTQTMPPVIWLYALLMGIVATFFPNLFNTMSVNAVGAANMAIINSVGPVFTILLEWWVLNTSTTLTDWLGMLLVIVGVGLLLRPESAHKLPAVE
jgi:drug/metabolite transporter (DMT)-like permease